MATDITKVPYAQWLEGVLQEMVESEPDKIAIIWLRKDVVGTVYYGCENDDRSVMIQAITEDSLLQFIANNRNYIRDLLKRDEGEGEGEDGLYETDSESDSEG